MNPTNLPSKLLVYVGGLGQNRSQRLLQRVKSEYGSEWKILHFEHGLKPWTNKRLEDTVNDLQGQIAEWAGDTSGHRSDVKEIRLVGHSAGGLLLRAAFLLGAGLFGNEPLFKEGGWASKVTRIVLVGTPNNGFRPELMPITWQLAYWVLSRPRSQMAVEDVRAGGYWIVNLQLRWVTAMRSMVKQPRIVQVLASNDRLMNEHDIVDNLYMRNVVNLPIPGTTHGGLVDLSDGIRTEAKWAILSNAIFGKDLPENDDRVVVSQKRVYFILHGIRTSAHEGWIGRLGDALEAENDAGVNEIVKLNYGFFSAIQFALPWTRHRNVHRFLRVYAEKCATYNPDNFYFAGHSNGTFMMARAMTKVSAMRFDRIFLAGCVLPTDFRWDELFDRRQIGAFRSSNRASPVWRRGAVHNDRAAIDFPVGCLCSWLHALGNVDLGTGGYDGFEDDRPTEVHDHELAFAPGHGSALENQPTRPGQVPILRMVEVARYLGSGASDAEPQFSQPHWFGAISRAVGLAPVAWGIVALLVFGFASIVFLLVLATGLLVGLLISASILAFAYLLLRII